MDTGQTTHLGALKKPNLLRRLYDWTLGWAERPGGAWALFILAFAEASFFLVPPDVLLLALCAGAPKKSFKFAAICSVGSVLGGIFGYWIGSVIWESVKGFFIPFIFSAEAFSKVQELYNENAFVSILAAAFTPIPFKVFTIAAGVFHVSLLTLVAASVIGRSARFFMVAGTIFFFGARVKAIIEKYFDWLAWVLLILGIGGFIAVKYLH